MKYITGSQNFDADDLSRLTNRGISSSDSPANDIAMQVMSNAT